ncbi:MAG TPA: hypothetical protein VG319_00155, partial [Polyangia bacterium]|nr:hypothetical protein [Polyangia bacterium]
TDDGATGGSNTVDADATGAAGTAGDFDPPPPRPINVKPGGVSQMSFNGQSMYLNRNKPIMGKLFLLLGGICTGTGAGGFEAFIKQYGFHVFAPITQTCVAGAPSKYKTVLQTTPNDPEANRQVADARMELWDGKDRVDWVTVAAGASILEETIGAIKAGVAMEPEADWGYFLNTDGTLRTTDVWVVGYSWGSQTWAMISSYVRFGRVITTSGPTDEGFPNASWITHPSATPNDRKYLLVGQTTPYPAEIEPIIPNVMKAGWIGAVTNVTPTSPGPYTAAQHLFAMIGGNGGVTPPGHTVFCNDNPMDGWLPLCRYVLGVP